MEPTAEELSGELKEIRREQKDLRERLLSLQENQLREVQQKADALESDVKLVKKIGPVAFAAATIVLLVLGYGSFSLWKQSVADEIKTEAMNSLSIELYPLIDRTLVQSTDIEKLMAAIDPEKPETANEALLRVGIVAKDQPEREYIFRRYMDLLILLGDYKAAYTLLRRVQRDKIFPKRYLFSKTFSAAAFVLWVESFYDQADWTKEEARNLVKEARECLEDAKNIAEKNPYRGEADQEMRTYHYYSFLFDLSENKDGASETDLKKFLTLQGELDWPKVIKSNWFQRLLKQRPHVRTHLEGMCKKTFPNGTTTKDNI